MRFIDTINNYKADPTGWIGSGIMLIFASIAGYRWHTTGIVFFALLVLRDLTASWFLITRKSKKVTPNSRSNEVLAYVSSAFPFAYFNSFNSFSQAELLSSILAIIGFTISTLALFDLGRSFGVSPANRGLVQIGLYRYVRHPMYFGYIISESGFIFLNPYNLSLWIISTILYFYRSKLEDAFLQCSH